MAIKSVDMTGKQVMITGCTAGLGRAAAIALADMGATLSLVCRNRSKGEALIKEIQRKTARQDCDLYVGDMGSQHDIRTIATAYIAKNRPLDVLFNNAGMVGSDFAKNNGWFARVAMTLIKPVARSPRKGAESGIYLCTSPEVDGKTGGYYYNCAINKTRPAARNDEDAKRLWELSEQYVGATL